MAEPLQAPFTRQIRAVVPAVAGGADDTTPLDIAPFDATITKVTFLADAAVTGANTNTRKLEVIEGGADGTGTTSAAAKQFNSGVNAVQNDDTDITLSATPANLVVAAGDSLIWKSTHVGTGIADPGGLVILELTRR